MKFVCNPSKFDQDEEMAFSKLWLCLDQEREYLMDLLAKEKTEMSRLTQGPIHQKSVEKYKILLDMWDHFIRKASLIKCFSDVDDISFLIDDYDFYVRHIYLGTQDIEIEKVKI